MKMLGVKQIIAAGFLAVVAFSGTIAYSFDNGHGCNFSPHDPYAPDALMLRGKYKGRCMDTSAKRAVQIISQADQNHVTIANYRKGGKFYTAQIPLHAITKVSYLVVDLNSKPINAGGVLNISHTEIRIKFANSDSITLLPQNPADTATTDGDMVLSYNFMGPEKVGYDPVAGFDEDLFGGVVQFFSMQDEATTRFIKNKFNVYEMPLKVSASQGAEILLHAAKVSEQLGYESAYDTWSNNCTTQLYDIMDAALKLKAEPFRFSAAKANDTGLIPGILALNDRNLILHSSKLTLVNHEFNYDRFPSWSNVYFGYWTGKTVQDVQKAFWIRK